MNDEGLIFARQALDRERDRYGCQRRVRIEERLEQRKGWSWREMCLNGSEQAGECVQLLNRKRVNIAQSTSGVEVGYLLLSTERDDFVQEQGTSCRLRIITILVV